MTEKIPFSYKKVSTWLSELDTHGVYNSDGLAKSFTQDTGIEAPWLGQGHNADVMLTIIKSKSEFGALYTDVNCEKHISTYELVYTCVDQFVTPLPWQHNKSGMGSAVRACIEKIKQCGY